MSSVRPSGHRPTSLSGVAGQRGAGIPGEAGAGVGRAHPLGYPCLPQRCSRPGAQACLLSSVLSEVGRLLWGSSALCRGRCPSWRGDVPTLDDRPKHAVPRALPVLEPVMTSSDDRPRHAVPRALSVLERVKSSRKSAASSPGNA